MNFSNSSRFFFKNFSKSTKSNNFTSFCNDSKYYLNFQSSGVNSFKNLINFCNKNYIVKVNLLNKSFSVKQEFLGLNNLSIGSLTSTLQEITPIEEVTGSTLVVSNPRVLQDIKALVDGKQLCNLIRIQPVKTVTTQKNMLK